MPRSRRPALCAGCGQRPPRKIKFAKYCSPCISRKPKVACMGGCGKEYAPDVMIGRRCRPCVSQAAHNKRVAQVYSITPEEYQLLLAHQGGKCFICWRKPAAKRLAVDHRHSCCSGPTSCGRCIRGLLCRSCNRDVLGHLGDSVEALERAIVYLTSPPAAEVLGIGEA